MTSVAAFLYETLSELDSIDVDLISLATSSRDTSSVRIVNPVSWRSGPQLTKHSWGGRPYVHAGAWFTELEFMRYSSRQRLTALLSQYDLVQVVAGTPAWANVCRDVKVPICLQVATLTSVERERRMKVETGPVSWWRRGMTAIASRLDLAGLDLCDLVFVENAWMQRVVGERIGQDKVVFAPPGIDVHVFYPAEQSAQKPSSYFLSVGRFADPRKNVPLLFRAYAQVLANVPEAPRLVLAGKTSPTLNDWKLADHLGIRQNIEFYQSLDIHELAALYRGAELFVLASDEEGLGMVILEAMASGLPIVSTRSGGPDELVEEGVNGYLTGVGDAHGLARSIERIIGSCSLQSSMATRSREIAVSRHSLQSTGSVFVNTYLARL